MRVILCSMIMSVNSSFIWWIRSSTSVISTSLRPANGSSSKKHLRSQGQRHGDFEFTFIAIGKLRGGQVHLLGDTYSLKGIIALIYDAGRMGIAQQTPQQSFGFRLGVNDRYDEIVENRQRVKNRDQLKRSYQSEGNPLMGALVGYIGAEVSNGPCRRREKAGEEIEKS